MLDTRCSAVSPRGSARRPVEILAKKTANGNRESTAKVGLKPSLNSDKATMTKPGLGSFSFHCGPKNPRHTRLIGRQQ